MPRHRQDPPPPDRVVAVLGARSHVGVRAGVDSRGGPDAGWVPRRDDLDPGGRGTDLAVRGRARRGRGAAAGASPVSSPSGTPPRARADLRWAGREAAGTQAEVTGSSGSPFGRPMVARTLLVEPSSLTPEPLATEPADLPSPDPGSSGLGSFGRGSFEPGGFDRGSAAQAGAGRHRRPAPPPPTILSVPAGLRQARIHPPRAAVVGLLLVVLVAAGVFGVRVALARAAAVPRPVAASGTGAAAPRSVAASGLPATGLVTRSVPPAFATGAGVPSAPQPPSAALAWVDVVGQVRHAGVVRLPPGARVLDAVRAAGGALPGADLDGVNLARPVTDGEQIVVPKPGQLPQAIAPGVAAPGAGGAGAGSATAAVVDLNAADATALDALPGVGPVLAQRILDWRTEHGRFTSVDELGEVSGIGDKLLAQLRSRVRV